MTDKAVSKWERDLSFPDINSIPKLAEVFETSADELMQVQTATKENKNKSKATPAWICLGEVLRDISIKRLISREKDKPELKRGYGTVTGSIKE